MGKVKAVEPVKLVIGIFSSDVSLIESVKGMLEKKFGKIDFESPFFDFNRTDYYRKEMGENLRRKFYAFERLTHPESLAKIKIFTNYLEKKLADTLGRRKVNIDPGYLNLAKFVLATTKDYSHRLYLRRGIFAEATLSFRDGTFQSFPWTYPDYSQKEYIEIFNQIRKIYNQNLNI